MSPQTRRRDLGLACLIGLLLALLPLREGLFEPGERTLLAPDSASVHLPWRAQLTGLGEDGVQRPRNPGLSDQALFFYPYQRFVLDSWLRTVRERDLAHAPLWNPDINLGVPALGNPQAGVLDPQVLGLLPLVAAWGDRGFHLGSLLMGALRLGAAAAGAFLLARRLGLSRPAAGLAATGFGLSGFSVAWLGHALGHVTPFLPWMLLCIERMVQAGSSQTGTSEEGAAEQSGPRIGTSAAWLGVLFAGSIYAGHSETSFYGGCAAGLVAVSSFTRNKRASLASLAALFAGALVSLPMVLPFLEYLSLSGAKALRSGTLARPMPDFLALGAIGLSLLALHRLRAPAQRAGEAREPRLDARRWVAVSLVVAGLLVVLTARGLAENAGLSLIADLHGKPGFGSGFVGSGSYPEEISGFLPAGILALALAAALTRGGRLPSRGLYLALGFGALALVLQTPGLLELKRWLPLVGLGATVRAAVVSSLFLSLLAGEAFDCASRVTRLWAGVAMLGVAGALLISSNPPDADPVPPENDEFVHFTRVPPANLTEQRSSLEGWIAPDFPLERVGLAVIEAGADPEGALEIPIELYDGSSGLDSALDGSGEPPPAGARGFRAEYLQTNRLSPGRWTFELRLYGTEPEPIARRIAAVSTLARRPQPSKLGLGLILASLLLVGGSSRLARGALVALIAVQALWFAERQNPVVPVAEAFPPTRTETLLEADLGGRFLSDPGVFPPSTGMLSGLRSLDGYDALEPVEFSKLKLLLAKPGQQGLLGFHARGVQLSGPFFSLCGVSHLVLRSPLEQPGWSLVSGPPTLETFVYRADDPSPLAYVVPAIAPSVQVIQRWESEQIFEPLDLAAYDGTFQIDRPATRVSMRELGRGARRLELEIELDGDGLLGLSEQHYPGWRATVDGVETEVELLNFFHRGLPLRAGTHRVVLRYVPTNFWLSAVLAGAGLIGLVFLFRLRR